MTSLHSFLIGVFLVPAAYQFLRAFAEKSHAGIPIFSVAISRYKIFPFGLVKPVAVLILSGEILCGALLLIPAAIPWAACMLIFFGAAFILAQLSAIVRGLKIECGCRGNSSQIIGVKTLAWPVIFFCLGALVITSGSAIGWRDPAALSYWLGGLLGVWFVVAMEMSLPVLKIGKASI